MTDAYKKAYEREKQARFSAEKLLDEKTREVQSSIDMIQHQFNDLMKQKNEADYLLAVARLTQDEKGVTSIVDSYLQASIDFLGVKMGRYSYLQSNSLTCRPVIGSDADIPKYTADFYKKIYGLEARKIIHVSQLEDKGIETLMLELGIDRVGFVPIRCFGKVATVCEFYLPQEEDFNSVLLDQCEISAYQIGSIIEGNINKKKLESSYAEVKSSHEKLKQAQSQLVQSEKMASLGQLAAGVAHEINNPIGFVMSNIGTLKEYYGVILKYVELTNKLVEQSSGPECEEIKALDEEEDLNFIVNDIDGIMSDCSDGLKRVKDIVANLKSFARSDDEESNEFDINECIVNTMKVVWNELKYKVTLHKSFAQNLPLLKGHEGQVGQVIMNMLVNAAHAIDEKGDIFITTSQSSGNVQIKIRDNGKGMSDEVKAKIFDPFFTTKGVNEGTGLGLSISYGLIESHGGQIEVNSKEGEGTEFIITLPSINGEITH